MSDSATLLLGLLLALAIPVVAVTSAIRSGRASHDADIRVAYFPDPMGRASTPELQGTASTGAAEDGAHDGSRYRCSARPVQSDAHHTRRTRGVARRRLLRRTPGASASVVPPPRESAKNQTESPFGPVSMRVEMPGIARAREYPAWYAAARVRGGAPWSRLPRLRAVVVVGV